MGFNVAAGQTAPQNHPANNFDFLRLIGAVLVVYGHSYPLTGTGGPGFAANAPGTIGVKIFFVISGYLVALSWLRDPHLPRFLLRRSLRIFPALAVVVLLSVVVLGPVITTLPLSAYFQNGWTAFYLRNIALYINYGLPGVFETNVYPLAVNGSLWSLPVEFSMYLLTPLLLSRLVNFNRFNLAALAIGLAGVSVLLIRTWPRTSIYVLYATNVWNWLEVAPYFLFGAAFAHYRLEWLTNIYVAFVGLFALGVFAMSATAEEAMLVVVLPYAVLSFGLGYTAVFEQLTGKNDLSYGVFLFGFPVQQTITAVAGPQIGPWANCLISLIVCSCLAYLSWNLVERPMLSWKPLRHKAAPESEPVTVSVPG
jgi:peptidoglycan/LPS O-acetylase OafA/YrhL